jgi:O-antigen/teichoic acid export membrane protein
MILALPLAAAGIALARPIILLVYGADYAPAIVIMQVLFIPFATLGISHSALSVIYGLNQPVYVLKVGAVLAILVVGLNLWLIPQFGIMGAAIAVSVPRLVALPSYVRFVSKKLQVSWPIGDTIRIAVASIALGLVLFVLQYFLDIIASLVLAIPAGILVYVTALLSLHTVDSRDIKILRQVQNSVPLKLRSKFAYLVSIVERFIQTKSTIPDNV